MIGMAALPSSGDGDAKTCLNLDMLGHDIGRRPPRGVSRE